MRRGILLYGWWSCIVYVGILSPLMVIFIGSLFGVGFFIFSFCTFDCLTGVCLVGVETNGGLFSALILSCAAHLCDGVVAL